MISDEKDFNNNEEIESATEDLSATPVEKNPVDEDITFDEQVEPVIDVSAGDESFSETSDSFPAAAAVDDSDPFAGIEDIDEVDEIDDEDDEEEDDYDFSFEEEPSKSGSKKVAFLALILVAILCGVGYFFVLPMLSDDSSQYAANSYQQNSMDDSGNMNDKKMMAEDSFSRDDSEFEAENIPQPTVNMNDATEATSDFVGAPSFESDNTIDTSELDDLFSPPSGLVRAEDNITESFEFETAPDTEVAVVEMAVEPTPDFPDANEEAFNSVVELNDSSPVAVQEDVTAPTPNFASANDNVASVVDSPDTPEPAKEPDVYYNSQINVPSGALAGNVGPRKLDPTVEPASKLVVVQKTQGAGSAEAQIVAANRAFKLGRYESASVLYGELYSRNPRDPRILMGQAVTYQKLGQDAAALQTYEELLKIDPENGDAIVNMLGLLRNSYPEVAVRRLLNLHDKYPTNAGIVAQLGVSKAGLGQTEEALKYLGTAAGFEPENAQHMFNMAVIADRAGRAVDAVSFYEKSLEIDSMYGGGRSIPRSQIYDRLSILR